MQKITNDLLALAQNGDETAVAALIARMMPAKVPPPRPHRAWISRMPCRKV